MLFTLSKPLYFGMVAFEILKITIFPIIFKDAAMQKKLFMCVMFATVSLLSACQSMPMTKPSPDGSMPHPAPISAHKSMPPHQPIFYGATDGLPFSEAVKVGPTLFLSGQIGLKDGKLVEGGIEAETKQIFDNINQVLLQNGYQKSDLVKCTAMLKNMKQFSAFNQAYKAALTPPYPARSAYGVTDLALGANVEVECIAAK